MTKTGGQSLSHCLCPTWFTCIWHEEGGECHFIALVFLDGGLCADGFGWLGCFVSLWVASESRLVRVLCLATAASRDRTGTPKLTQAGGVSEGPRSRSVLTAFPEKSAKSKLSERLPVSRPRVREGERRAIKTKLWHSYLPYFVPKLSMTSDSTRWRQTCSTWICPKAGSL